MISLLDLLGAAAALCATASLLLRDRGQLPAAGRWIALLVCALTVLINAVSFWSWSGLAVGARIAENLGDYLQILQPALWGMFFYVFVQSAQRREIIKSRQQMRDLVEHMPVILHAYDRSGRLLAWNQSAESASGYSRDEVLGKDNALQQLFPEEQAREQIEMECLYGGGYYHHRIDTMQGKQHQRQIAWYNISHLYPIEGWANWRIGLDLTEQLAAQQQLEHLATHDELTGLPNRTLLRDRLFHALSNATRDRSHGALLMLDLDHFKMINDRHGYPVGDEVLRAVSRRLNQCLQPTDTLARTGSDEFVVLLEHIQSPDAAAMTTRRLLQAIADDSFDIYDDKIRVNASAGVTLFPEDDIRLEELLKNVDLAAYAAKQQGRNTYRFYSRDIHTQVRRQHRVAEQLREAIAHNQLQLHYHPQMALPGQRLAGVEALLRWPGADHERLSPEVFVPIAESMGLMPALGDWVIETAFEQAANWQAHHMPLPVAINLSALQLHQPELQHQLCAKVERWALRPEDIDLEITESAMMENPDAAVETLKQLRNKGFNVSLDDFGTGYSSLSYLKHFPISRLKIDKSFIQNMATEPADDAIVENVIRLSHHLGLEVTAEGVETREQALRLADEKCDYIQGFYCSRPLASEAVETFWQRQQTGL